MVVLVASVGSGKNGNGTVRRIVQGDEWDKVWLIMDNFWMEHFEIEGETPELHTVRAGDSEVYTSVRVLKQNIENGLKPLENQEIALNISAGNGKLHMAILSAIENLRIKHKLAVLTRDGVEIL